MLTRSITSLKSAIQTRARKLGFDLVGVTDAKPPLHFDFFERWLEAGRHGEMAYLATGRSRQRRADPRQILPDCRAIIVLGMRYSAPDVYSQEENGVNGRVASYAWGQDYHLAISERLPRLIQFIEDRLGKDIASCWYTDTGPVLERDLAQRAGLGWIGKNTCLINPVRGSYYFLAVIFLGVDLEPDPPFLFDRCGSCTRCIQACPTGCILPDRSLDARRCISYLTIELKGAIPVELRPQMGNWVFGCDICQQVCPWNRHLAESIGEPAFDPLPRLPFPNLIAELALSLNEFRHKFRSSPVLRAKRGGYLRNVVVALANQANKNPEIIPSAITALSHSLHSDPEPLVRGHAAWALAQFDDRAARQSLLKAIETEMDLYVLSEIRNWL
jgi:epoxyqueuosine reductase